jgi:pimeloyl-ACP methyl ester carboxylesterase
VTGDLAIPTLDGVEHRHAQVGDLRMHYAEAGDPQADVVVLVHGWPQNWFIWRDLIGPLAERFHVIAPDLRGLGWTEAPRRGYDKRQLAEDVLSLLDEVGIGRVRWVGHDWGAFAGFHAATLHPDRIERFMPCSVPHPWPPEGPPDPRRILNAWYQFVLAAPLLGRLAIGTLDFHSQVLRSARKRGEWGDELDLYERAVKRPGYVDASIQYYRTFVLHEMLPLARGQFRDRRLTVPTRLVVGTEDPVAKGLGDEFRDYADDMELEWVEGVGHFLPEERPEVLRELALGFLP